MSAIECNADVDHHCDADDGEPCPRCVQACRAAEADYLVSSAAERNVQRYAQDMHEAGRGHLLTDAQREMVEQ